MILVIFLKNRSDQELKQLTPKREILLRKRIVTLKGIRMKMVYVSIKIIWLEPL